MSDHPFTDVASPPTGVRRFCCALSRSRIDSSVRKDRRLFWFASIAIQTRWRMLPKREYYRLLQRATKMVQSHFRMWSDRRVYRFVREKV